VSSLSILPATDHVAARGRPGSSRTVTAAWAHATRNSRRYAQVDGSRCVTQMNLYRSVRPLESDRSHSMSAHLVEYSCWP
jgi:hypothetical protein